MSASQRNKGAGFEREIAQTLTSALGYTIKRNIGQARDSGNDLDVGPLVVECKRRKTLGTVYGWLDQAVASMTEYRKRNHAGDKFLAPTVIAREDGGEALIIMKLDDFLHLFGAELKKRMNPLYDESFDEDGDIWDEDSDEDLDDDQGLDDFGRPLDDEDLDYYGQEIESDN